MVTLIVVAALMGGAGGVKCLGKTFRRGGSSGRLRNELDDEVQAKALAFLFGAVLATAVTVIAGLMFEWRL
jgi:hypothetical protein